MKKIINKPSELAMQIYAYKQINPGISFYELSAKFNLQCANGVVLYGKAKVYFDDLAKADKEKQASQHKHKNVIFASKCGNCIITDNGQQYIYYCGTKLVAGSFSLHKILEIASKNTKYPVEKINKENI
jgi:cytidylate kinase